MTLVDSIDLLTKPGLLYQPQENEDVRCTACAHRCLIHPGKRGICKVRFNDQGTLRVPWGYVAGLQADPVEKKPFFHLLPGSTALTFGMLGCNMHCDFCQNWISSQALRDPEANFPSRYVQKISPEEIVQYGLQNDAQIVVSSYNEPLITSEWAVSIFEKAQKSGLKCAFVSNGYATPEAINYLRPYLVGYKIDLKCMQDRHYRSLGAVLQNVLDSIQTAHQSGLWVEVVTLVIPGFNDSTAELWDTASFLASVSRDIPWHVTAFHPDYKMVDTDPTPTHTLQRAADIGQEAGLNFVYAGNLPGKVGSLEDTLCPTCQTRLIQRIGFTVVDYQITAAGTCPSCGNKVPGIWTERPETIQRGHPGWPRRVIR